MSEALRRETVKLPSGVVVSYVTGGPGDAPAVVLLHGGGVDNALLSWGAAAETLAAAGYRVLAPEHPGYGESPLPDFPVTVPHLLDYLTQFVERLGLRDVSLVGVSMGGAMALGYTLARPKNVRRVVLVGPYGIQDSSPAHALSYLLVRIPGLTTWSAKLTSRSPWLMRQSVRQIVRNPSSLTPELMDQVMDAVRHPTASTAFAQFQRHEIQRHGMRTNFTPRLGEIEQPVLIVQGSRDIGVPVPAARRAADLLPDGRLVVFEGAGHWTQRDCPARFTELMLGHLAG